MSEELTPRQINFLRYYLDPKSKTFSNVLQSALKAGYSQEYSESLTTKDLNWLAENVGTKKKLIAKAERNLDDLLDNGEEKTKADLTKFTLSKLNKDYKDKVDITSDDKPIPLLNINGIIQQHDSDKEDMQPNEEN